MVDRKQAALPIGVGIVVIRDGKLLLGKRLSKAGYGTWALPGGKPESGESIEACAVRELQEETGLKLLAFSRAPGMIVDVDGLGTEWQNEFVLANETSGEPRPMEPDRCADWKWFTLDALPEPLFPPLRAFIRRAKSSNIRK